MTWYRFWLLFFCIQIMGIVIKIYQHNAYVRLLYEKQHALRALENKQKQHAILLARYFVQERYEIVSLVAYEKLGLKPIKLAQIKGVCL